MSKIIRTVRVSGPVVTLGEAERELYLEGEDREEAGLDLGALLEARMEEVRRQVEEEWKERLQREKEAVQAAADQRMKEAEEQWRAEKAQIHQQRYEEGYQAGLDAREAEAREAVQRLDALHHSFEQERAQVLKEAELLVVELAAALARRITGIQAEFDRKVLVQVIRTALEHLSDHSSLEIRVHPDDLQIARRFARMWVEKVEKDAVLRVIPSDHVARGGCMIEGEAENVDARLDAQCEVLKQVLRASVEEKGGGAGGAGADSGKEGSDDGS